VKFWIIGRKATIASNGHDYVAEPFIAFISEHDADAACDMIERVSGERPMKAEAELMSVARPDTLSIEGRK
jgi:hypothetical protein